MFHDKFVLFSPCQRPNKTLFLLQIKIIRAGKIHAQSSYVCGIRENALPNPTVEFKDNFLSHFYYTLSKFLERFKENQNSD